jgi:hypothetical protein
MGGAAGVGAGLGIMGGTLGGIGDIMAAHGYKRPKLPPPTPEELRLRAEATNQILGGSQQYLGGEALLNQLVPTMMGMIPGMSVRANAPAAGGANANVPGMTGYQQALAQYHNLIGAQQQVNALKGQLKGLKKGPDKQAVRQQLKAAQRVIKTSPSMTQAERNVFQAGTAPPTFSMDTGGAGGASPADGGGGGGAAGGGPPMGGMDPSTQSSLGSILGWLHGAQGTGMSPGDAASSAGLGPSWTPSPLPTGGGGATFPSPNPALFAPNAPPGAGAPPSQPTPPTG